MPSGREGLYLAGMTLQVPAGVGVDLSADNCDIDASGVSGAAHLESSNGALTVNTAEAVDLRTSNGGIHGAAGSGGAYTSNGDITLVWIDPTQPLTLETSNGAVRVTIPAHAAITLDLDTSNGSIRLPDGGARVGTSYRGALLGGGPLLTVDTSNGDIEVLRAP